MDALPDGMIRAATTNGTAANAGYMPGFGNDFETEALPGALGLAAKGLDITDQQLIKLVESGGLAARDLLPALAQSLKEMEGDTDTAAGGWARLENAVVQALQGMGEGGGIDVMTTASRS